MRGPAFDPRIAYSTCCQTSVHGWGAPAQVEGGKDQIKHFSGGFADVGEESLVQFRGAGIESNWDDSKATIENNLLTVKITKLFSGGNSASAHIISHTRAGYDDVIGLFLAEVAAAKERDDDGRVVVAGNIVEALAVSKKRKAPPVERPLAARRRQ